MRYHLCWWPVAQTTPVGHHQAVDLRARKPRRRQEASKEGAARVGDFVHPFSEVRGRAPSDATALPLDDGWASIASLMSRVQKIYDCSSGCLGCFRDSRDARRGSAARSTERAPPTRVAAAPSTDAGVASSRENRLVTVSGPAGGQNIHPHTQSAGPNTMDKPQ